MNTFSHSLSLSQQDVGQTLTYALGGCTSIFKIDNNGQLSVKASNSINYEAIASYACQVTVTDNGSPALSSTVAVTVNINDVNGVFVWLSRICVWVLQR